MYYSSAFPFALSSIPLIFIAGKTIGSVSGCAVSNDNSERKYGNRIATAFFSISSFPNSLFSSIEQNPLIEILAVYSFSLSANSLTVTREDVSSIASTDELILKDTFFDSSLRKPFLTKVISSKTICSILRILVSGRPGCVAYGIVQRSYSYAAFSGVAEPVLVGTE